MVLGRMFPSDIRVEKEAKTLQKCGHQLYLLCMKAPDLPNYEIYDGIRVTRADFDHRIPLVRSLLYFKNTMLFRNNLTIRQIRRFIADNAIDVLHIHDLPLVKSGIIAAETAKIPIIADFHENYPATMQYYLNSRTGLRFRVKRFLNGFQRWKSYEIQCANKVDHIIVVIEEAKTRLMEYGIPEEKVTVVSNTEEIVPFLSYEMDSDILNKYANRFVIAYIGGFGHHRGLDTVLKSLPKLLGKISNLSILLVGAGHNQAELEQLACDLKIPESVVFTGWQPFPLVPSYIEVSDICIIPHHSTPGNNATIPHKLFQYMLMKKPVIVSSCKPLARIIDETGAGLVFRAGNSDDFAAKCFELLNPVKRKRMGENGKAAVLAKYNWEVTGRSLSSLYQSYKKKRNSPNSI